MERVGKRCKREEKQKGRERKEREAWVKIWEGREGKGSEEMEKVREEKKKGRERKEREGRTEKWNCRKGLRGDGEGN